MKPILSTFVFSEDSKEVPNPSGNGASLHIINPQNVFRPPFVPCTYSFSVAFGVLNLQKNREYQLEFNLLSPTGENVITTGVINIKQDVIREKSLPDIANGFMFSMDYRNVVLKEEGKYIGQVIMNKELIGEVPLVVYPKEQ